MLDFSYELLVCIWREIGRIIWVFQLPLAYSVLFEYELGGRGKKLYIKFISLIKVFEEKTSKTPFADVNVAAYTDMKTWCPVNLLFWESEITCTVVSLAILKNCSFISNKFLSSLDEWVAFILLWPF